MLLFCESLRCLLQKIRQETTAKGTGETPARLRMKLSQYLKQGYKENIKIFIKSDLCQKCTRVRNTQQ